MVELILASLSLSPAEAGNVALAVVLTLFTLDVIAARDDIPGNTPRAWLLRIARWSGRRPSGADGGPASPRSLRDVPLTGAPVPFMLGVLLGHFFHPFEQPHTVPGGLAWVAVIALGIGVATWWTGRRRIRFGARGSSVLVVVGIAAGMLLWPVGP